MADDIPSILKDKKPNQFTYRGLPISSNKGKAVSGGKVGLPQNAVETVRKRSGSIRRLSSEALTALTTTTRKGFDPVKAAANRELQLRTDMVEISQDQHTQSPRMKSKGAATMQDVEALRFASSLAEEAAEEQEQDTGVSSVPGMIGVARINGSTGVGFSGQEDQQGAIDQLSQRMLTLQKHYEKHNPTDVDNWSHQLEAVSADTVLADTSNKSPNVCAASRASAAAMGSVTDELSASGRVSRASLPQPDALVEMQNSAFTKKPGDPFDVFQEHDKVSEIVTRNNAEPPITKSTSDQYDKQTVVSTRKRSASLVGMVRSCDQCMAEVSKRSDHSHSH